jgi:hypothetical protein
LNERRRIERRQKSRGHKSRRSGRRLMKTHDFRTEGCDWNAILEYIDCTRHRGGVIHMAGASWFSIWGNHEICTGLVIKQTIQHVKLGSEHWESRTTEYHANGCFIVLLSAQWLHFLSIRIPEGI